MALPLFGLNIAFMFIAAFNSKFAFQSLIAAIFVDLYPEQFIVATGGTVGLSGKAFAFLGFYIASLVAAYMRG